MPVLRAFSEGGGGASGGDASEGGANPKQEELPVGSAVKARFQGGALWRVGTVAEHNADGTVDVLYEERTLEQGVPRDLVRGVNLTQTQTGGGVSEGAAADDGPTLLLVSAGFD